MLVVTNTLASRFGKARYTGFGLHSMVRRYQALSDRAMWAGAVGNAYEVRVPLLPPEQ